MIPFRTQRMATSVVNRILDVYDGHIATPPPGEPAAPTPLLEGQQLQKQIEAPKAPVDATPENAEQIALQGLAK